MTTEVQKKGRGGKRAGAGRPPTYSRQIKKAERDARALAVATKAGFGKIAETMPEVITTIIKMALGYEHEVGGETKYYPPNEKMLKILIDIGLGSLSVEDFGGDRHRDDFLGKAVKKAAEDGKLELHQHNTYVEAKPDVSVGPLNNPRDAWGGG